VKNDYDAVKLGLKLEEEILKLFKDEFDRFCSQVTLHAKITYDDKKSLLEKKIISVLASEVGKGKAVPESRRDCIYFVMSKILERAKATDRLNTDL